MRLQENTNDNIIEFVPSYGRLNRFLPMVELNEVHNDSLESQILQSKVCHLYCFTSFLLSCLLLSLSRFFLMY